MKWFKNLRTANKLMMSFGFLALLMSGVGYLGIRGMGSIQEALRVLHHSHALGALQLEKANAHLVATGRAARGLMLRTDAAGIEEHRQLVLAERQQCYNEFEQFSKTLLTEDIRAKAAAALAAFQALYEEQDQVIDLVRKNQRPQAIAHMETMTALAAKADVAIAELSKTKQQRMQEKADLAESEFESSRKEMIGIILLAVALAIAMGAMIGRLIARPLNEAVRTLEAVSGGDFTKHLEVTTTDEVGQMAKSLNQAVGNMRQALIEVSDASNSVSSAAQQLAKASGEVASGAQEQASSLEETASSLEEMSSTVKQNAENARQASQLAAGSREAADKGGQVVNSAVAAMSEINQASTRIADIITTIDEIAFQTNLLALNAAVEAARAGEQGRGFAVVASEVRNLAQRSATAAKEIKGLIQDSVKKVDNGSELVNRSGQTLSEIVQSVKRVTDIVAEIAAASQEQATGIEQVNKAAMQMDQVTQANSAQTEEMSSTAQGLSSSAEQLQALVARFHLGTETRGANAKAVKRPVAPAKRKKPEHSGEPALAALAHEVSVKDGFEEF